MTGIPYIPGARLKHTLAVLSVALCAAGMAACGSQGTLPCSVAFRHGSDDPSAPDSTDQNCKDDAIGRCDNAGARLHFNDEQFDACLDNKRYRDKVAPPDEG